MANYANLLATIATNIYTNGNNEVTASMVKAACDAIVSGLGTMREVLPSSDLDDVIGNGSWILIDTNTYQNVPNNSVSGFLRVSAIEESRWYLQEFYSFNGGGLYKRRSNAGGTTWEDWQRVSDTGMRGYLPSSDLNDVTSFGTWLLIAGNTYTNVPDNLTAGFLRVSPCGTYILQEFYSFSSKRLYARHIASGVPTQWDQIGSGSSITNNYTFPEYSQVVNVSAHPSITTDTNNYLASTGDNTDRTADILAMLSTTGACHLGPGDFYIKDLQMPDSTSIIGSGMATHIYMLAGNGFAIKMGSRCQVKDFRLFGTSGSYTPVSVVGNRHGILWQGDYTQSTTAPISSFVSDIHISGFNGGGITCYDTGYGTNNFLDCVNVIMEDCDAGINISYWSEFHKFTNCRTRSCYYGCINNGGNNVFVNCDFSSCSGKAFVMDNSQGQSPNNSHGSCVGCVFNHTASNTGTGIEILDCDAGFIFSACQIFFSKIDIQDSDGVVFQGCNFGKNNCDISVDGGGVVLFANNMHQDTPPSITITNNTNVHFVNCYNRATGAAISA